MNISEAMASGLRPLRTVRYEPELWQDELFQRVMLRDMYKRPLALKALSLLAIGYSARSVAKSVNLSKTTVCKLRTKMLKLMPINCPCGQPTGHRGWCSYRFAHSAKRFATLQRTWGR